MDFTFTPEQDEAAELAAQILKDRATNERMKAVEADGRPVRPRAVGTSSATAGLLVAGAPGGVRRRRARPDRAVPGAGRGRPDRGARCPLAAHGPAARLLAELRHRRAEAAVAARRGDRANVLTAAVAEERAFAPERPTTVATPDGDGYRLTGSKAIVPAGPYADLFLVPAETPSGRRRLPGRARRRRA